MPECVECTPLVNGCNMLLNAAIQNVKQSLLWNSDVIYIVDLLYDISST